MENEPKPLSKLEDLQYQEKRALEEHGRLLKARENNPKDSSLKVEVDKAYDEWLRIRREIEQLEGDKGNE